MADGAIGIITPTKSVIAPAKKLPRAALISTLTHHNSRDSSFSAQLICQLNPFSRFGGDVLHKQSPLVPL